MFTLMEAQDNDVEYVITFRPVPGNWLAGPEYRLRGLLKASLRAFGFRCTVIKPSRLPPPASPRPRGAASVLGTGQGSV
jgi:hypothetical protein